MAVGLLWGGLNVWGGFPRWIVGVYCCVLGGLLLALGLVRWLVACLGVLGVYWVCLRCCFDFDVFYVCGLPVALLVLVDLL